MKPQDRPRLSHLVDSLILAALLALPCTAFAATWQWDGGAGTGDWQTPANWNPNSANNEFNGTFVSRLNVNGAQEIVYSAAEGNTVYGNTAAASRGLVIGSGALGSGTLRISGGSFSTAGSTAADVVGNTGGNTGTLIIDGGAYTSGSFGLALGIGGGPNSILTLNSGSATVTTLAFFNTNGTVNLDGGTLTVGTVAITAGNNVFNFNGGTYKLGAGTAGFSTFTSANIKAGGAVIDTNGFNATIGQSLLDAGGGGGLTKSGGAGTLTLTMANTYTGPTTVGAGVLNIQHASALGTVGGSTQVAANARLEMQGGITVTGESLTISGPGGVGNDVYGALRGMAGANTWTGDVVLNSVGTRIGTNAAGATLTISGTISSGVANSGLVVRNGFADAAVVLSGANSYSGTTQLLHGTTRLDGGDNRLPVGTSLLLGSNTVSGVLDLNGRNQEVAGLSVSGTGTANEIKSASPGTLTVNTPAASPSTYTGLITGEIALKKTGPDTLILTADNTYNGTTSVEGGTLRVNGMHSGSGLITVSAGATLGGVGSVSSNVDVTDAVLSPGAADATAGIFTVLNLSLTPASTLSFDLAAPFTSDGDFLSIAGNLTTLTGTLNINALPAFNAPALQDGDRWLLASYGGAPLGSHSLTVGSAPALSGGLAYAIDISLPNEVYLTVVPEAGTAGLLTVGLLLLARRARSKTS